MKMLLRRLKVFYVRSDRDLFDNIFPGSKLWQNRLTCVINVSRSRKFCKSLAHS